MKIDTTKAKKSLVSWLRIPLIRVSDSVFIIHLFSRFDWLHVWIILDFLFRILFAFFQVEIPAIFKHRRILLHFIFRFEFIIDLKGTESLDDFLFIRFLTFLFLHLKGKSSRCINNNKTARLYFLLSLTQNVFLFRSIYFCFNPLLELIEISIGSAIDSELMDFIGFPEFFWSRMRLLSFFLW